MHKTLLDILVDPVSKMPLQVKITKNTANGDILEGTLQTSDGRIYNIINGIPRFVVTEDKDQKQTALSFGFKWQQQNTYGSLESRAASLQWKMQRYGFKNVEEFRSHFGKFKRILDVGCGSGYSASLWLEALRGEWIGIDISEAIDVAQKRQGKIANTHFIQADSLQLPFPEQTFDMILAEGVLHHTPSTEQALKALPPLLQPGGEFIFYVYRKKTPVREFTDDYVREIVSEMPPEKAWGMLRPLTRLGQALAELRTEIEVPEDIPLLGIKAGQYDIQRLIYWHFAKLFWNETLTFEENNHVNFDWYHPKYAHRQTEEDVRQWCDEANLSIIHFYTQESGFSVRAIKS